MQSHSQPSYTYQDFFKYLKSINWRSFETFIQLNHFVVLVDFFPKSQYHFLVLPIDHDIDNLNQVDQSHVHLFQAKQQLASDLVDGLVQLDLQTIVETAYKYKKFVINKLGVHCFALTDHFIDKYGLSHQQLVEQGFVEYQYCEKEQQMFYLSAHSLQKLGEFNCDVHNLQKYSCRKQQGHKIGLDHNNRLYLQQQIVQKDAFEQKLNCFKYGFKMLYHRKPSLNILHLHLISQDFQVETLKRPHHWLAFNDSQFYILIEQVISELQDGTGIKIDMEQLESQYHSKSIKCHVCNECFNRDIQKLKQHYVNHF